MIKLKQVSLQFIAAFMLGMLAFSASAQAMPEPQALVKEASDNMLKALKDNEAELETNPQKIYIRWFRIFCFRISILSVWPSWH